MNKRDKDDTDQSGRAEGPQELDNPGRTPGTAEGDEDTVREALERNENPQRRRSRGRDLSH